MSWKTPIIVFKIFALVETSGTIKDLENTSEKVHRFTMFLKNYPVCIRGNERICINEMVQMTGFKCGFPLRPHESDVG